jgi:hypothetical protein
MRSAYPEIVRLTRVRFPISESAGQGSLFRPSRLRSVKSRPGFESPRLPSTWLGSASCSAVHHRDRSVSSETVFAVVCGMSKSTVELPGAQGNLALIPVVTRPSRSESSTSLRPSAGLPHRWPSGGPSDGRRVRKDDSRDAGATPTGQADRIRRLDECRSRLPICSRSWLA